jgi:hypothetical protein
VIPAFCFDDFACVRIFVDLNLARLATAGFCIGCRSATTRLRVEQIDYVLKAVTVLCQQSAQLGLKFNFFLKACVTLQGFEPPEMAVLKDSVV